MARFRRRLVFSLRGKKKAEGEGEKITAQVLPKVINEGKHTSQKDITGKGDTKVEKERKRATASHIAHHTHTLTHLTYTNTHTHTPLVPFIPRDSQRTRAVEDRVCPVWRGLGAAAHVVVPVRGDQALHAANVNLRVICGWRPKIESWGAVSRRMAVTREREREG